MSRPSRLFALLFAGLLTLGALSLLPDAEPRSGARVAVVFAPTGDQRRIHKVLREQILGARRGIEVAMFQFTSSKLAGALRLAANRVPVRVLLDSYQASGSNKYSQHQELEREGVPNLQVRYVVFPKTRNEYARIKFHHKFCIIDGVEVITGSYNWTVQADEKNFENLLVLRDRATARRYHEEFERIWQDEEITKSAEER